MAFGHPGRGADDQESQRRNDSPGVAPEGWTTALSVRHAAAKSSWRIVVAVRFSGAWFPWLAKGLPRAVPQSDRETRRRGAADDAEQTRAAVHAPPHQGRGRDRIA